MSPLRQRPALCLTVLLCLLSRQGAAAPAAPAPPTVAVMPFRDLSGAAGHIGEALRETVTADLKEISTLRVVERADMDRVLTEQQLQGRRADLDPSTAARVGKLLGAKYIITGAYQRALPQVRLTARVVQVETGEITGSAKVDGKANDLLHLQDQITAALLRSAGFAAPAHRVSTRPRKALKSLRGMELYGQAMQAPDDQARLGLLKLAVAEDASFVYAVNDLAALERRLRRYQEASDEAGDRVLRDLVTRLAAAKDQATADPLAQQLFGKLMALRRYHDLQRATRAYLARNYPAQPGAPGLSTTEMAGQFLVMSELLLHQHDALLRDGEDFLRRYPGSSAFASVKAQVEQAIAHKQKAREGKDKAAATLAGLHTNQRWDLCLIGTIYRGDLQFDEAVRLHRACLAVGRTPRKEALRDLAMTEVQAGLWKDARRDLRALELEDAEMYRQHKWLADQVPADDP